MEKNEFSKARAKLGKTQTKMAELLRASLKTVQSYEQGWRSIPAHVERHVLFLLSLKSGLNNQKACWTIRKCSAETRLHCPAWEFKAGKFCWFINGTMCEGKAQDDWNEKMKKCRACEVMASILELD
jgi:hypothetical protein